MPQKVKIRGEVCPFCKSVLGVSRVTTPNGDKIRCLECVSCKAYFYTEFNYNRLRKAADSSNVRLNRDVIIYYGNPVITFDNRTKKSTSSNKNNTKKKHKKKNVKNKNKSKSISDFPRETVKRIPKAIDSQCVYYRKSLCIYLNDNCDASSIRCPNRKTYEAIDKITKNMSEHLQMKNVVEKTRSVKESKTLKTLPLFKEIGITAIVITYNRKCVYEEHKLIDVIGKVRIVKSNGEIIVYDIPTSYCNECNLYFVLKHDFEIAKIEGVILCPVIDKTKGQSIDSLKSKTGNESRIHMLGYNVKKNSGYTQKQRQIILSNILENYPEISIHEIKSHLKRCASQHGNQKNYANAVKCWQEDYEFISQYKKGDMPQVIINKIVIGRN